MSRTTQTLVIQPGDIGRIAIAGDGFAVTEADRPVFEAAVDGDSFDDFRQGWHYSPPGGFEVLVFRNPNLAALTIEVVIWAGEFADRRFSATAALTTIPREDLAALVEPALVIGSQGAGALAANFAFVQLFNPAGSGVLIELEEIQFKSTAGTNYFLLRHDVQVGLVSGTAEVFADTRETVAPKGELTFDRLAAFGTGILSDTYTPGTKEKITFREGLRPKIAEGHGILIRPNTVNNDMQTLWRWREIPL